ncbi:MAG TPA: glycosyltransferase [Candidatus Nanopelagicales bacterium]|nr:glycosyltransferase [Candidatus Nanopelagicales bacterium]
MEVLILNWRDQTHPQGGGSEVFAETVAEGLARRGHRVTIFCAAHENAGPETVTSAGVRIVRAGGRLTVYSRAVMAFWRGRLGRPDVIVDVQNGLPFLARLWSRTPVVLLCHHVHREQWAVVLGPRAARFGWWVESQLSPAVHRGCSYVTVSDVSGRELAELGVDPAAIGVVHNGVDVPEHAVAPRSATPLLVVLGRLVPHKRVEYAIDTVARLRDEFPGLRLVVAGRGWWHDEIETHRDSLGLTDDEISLVGWIDEDEKDRLLSAAWLSLVPSLKEGWGIAVMEAAAHGTPSIAFREAGGVAESIVDGVTGILADDLDSFVSATRTLLADADLRRSLGNAARDHARLYSWDGAVDTMEKVLGAELQAAPAPDARGTHIVCDPGSRAEKAGTIRTVLAPDVDLCSARVLDDGCGSGAIAELLGRDSGARVVAVDRADARTSTGGHVFAQADGCALPFADASFDVVVSNHVLEHVGDEAAQVAYLREARRVLDPSGVLYLAVPNKHRLVEAHYGLPFLSWLPQDLADRAVRRTGRGTWYDVVPPTRTGLLRLLARAGFDVEDRTTDVARMRLADRRGAATVLRAVPEAAWAATLIAWGPTHVVVCRPDPALSRRAASLP